MTTVMSRSKSWVAFDSGLTPVSRGHLEETIINHAKKIGLNLDWLVSHQLTNGARRVAFTISAKDTNKLNTLLADLNRFFPSFAGDAELDELIEITIARNSGRAIIFPLSQNISSNVIAKDLITNSEIDSVIAIGEELPVDSILSLNDFIRPTFNAGQLELYVERVAGGLFAPVERKSPHECCGGHEAEAPISL